MAKNFRSVVFLLILFAIALFLIGFRLGKSVERMDKNYIPPIPVASAQPTPTPSKLALSTFSHPDCGISFLYPSDLKEKVSTDEARLTGDNQNIFITCDKDKVKDFKDELKDATPASSMTIKNQKVSLYEKEKGTKQWSLYNTLNAKTVIFEASENLVDLVLKTVEFVT